MYAGAKSVSPGYALYFATQEELLFALPQLVQQGDVILVKASRGMKLEQTVESLLSITK